MPSSVASLLILFGVAFVQAENVFHEFKIKPRLAVPPYSPDCFTAKDLLLVDDQMPGKESIWHSQPTLSSLDEAYGICSSQSIAYTHSLSSLVHSPAGPTVRAKVGDTVSIKWINEHPSEGVTIHYHGNLMNQQPYSDGTGGVNTCVVGPMQAFEQTFVADNAGTHYWHGHNSMQLMDGLQGVLIIEDENDPEEVALKELYDEERVVFLQDWYHKSGPYLRTSKYGCDSSSGMGEPFW